MPLLNPNDIRHLAADLGVRPTKRLGQNFVHDAGTVRRIARTAGVTAGDLVLEVGPGLGSLTLALLETGAHVTAIEIDRTLAGALPQTVATFMPEASERFAVLTADALSITGPADLVLPAALPQAETPDGAAGDDGAGGGRPAPTKLVANLPYNVAVPVILTLLAALPSLEEVLVMVQSEVADRLVAAPGSKVYGTPSAKVAWYGSATHAGMVSRTVFWPVPNVDSALVRIVRGKPPAPDSARTSVFAAIDAAFSQRRKTLRAALATWAGSPAAAESALRAAGIDPSRRGETLSIEEFCAVANAGPPTRPAEDAALPNTAGEPRA